jgi:hypothetical protein
VQWKNYSTKTREYISSPSSKTSATQWTVGAGLEQNHETTRAANEESTGQATASLREGDEEDSVSHKSACSPQIPVAKASGSLLSNLRKRLSRQFLYFMLAMHGLQGGQNQTALVVGWQLLL